MKYRCTKNVQLPFKVIPNIVETSTSVRYNITIRGAFDSKKEGTNVVLCIPTPPDAARCIITKPDTSMLSGFRSKNEKAKFNHQKNAIFWQIKKFQGDGEFNLTAEVKRLSSATAAPWQRPPISVDFVVGMFTGSHLYVRFLKIYESKNYETIKWVRYLTRAGQYQYRI